MIFSEAINDALIESMKLDNKVICYGLGVDDPKRIFGTTKGLKEKFGNERVFDMPTSENAMTGVSVGLAIGGYRSVVVHQRLDFFLLAMDQLVNSAAKWYYMFGGKVNIPMVIRLVIGRGWGQGPTHSQSLHSWFAHIPGLKVVMPATAADAKGLLMSSIFDGNPVLFLEHRWLHAQDGDVPAGDYRVPLGKAKLLKKGVPIRAPAEFQNVTKPWIAHSGLGNQIFIALQESLLELKDSAALKPLKKDGFVTGSDEDYSMIRKSIIENYAFFQSL